MGQMVYQLSY
nr:unnamed protein product [Callosobruchus chinensis]CAH7746387.1 unnamed protein product [Callosobruchus chinensis]